MAYIRILACALPRFIRIPLLKQNIRIKEYQSIQLCKRNSQLLLKQSRLYSNGDSKGLNFDEFCLQKVVIDVRDRYERQNSGQIPGSGNVPLSEVEYALSHLNDQQFEHQYGFKKPQKDEAIVFYCSNHSRAREAAQRARAIGYEKANFYNGGFNDYIKRKT